MIRNVVDSAFEYSRYLPGIGLRLAYCGAAAAYTLWCVKSVVDFIVTVAKHHK